MAGLPWETTYPSIVGVRLTGKLTGWASAKDIILEMLNRFTVKGGTGKIFEYFGEGAEELSATQKATITNMGAELGATTSVFVYDESIDAYLKSTGREKDAAAAAALSDILCRDEICSTDPERVYHQYLELDLGTIKPAHAGPFSPDRVTKVEDFKAVVSSEEMAPEGFHGAHGKLHQFLLFGSLCRGSDPRTGNGPWVQNQSPVHAVAGLGADFRTIKRDGIPRKAAGCGCRNPCRLLRTLYRTVGPKGFPKRGEKYHVHHL
jgi:hypothetical protein